MNTQVNWYAGTTLSAVSESGFVALEGPNDLLLDLWRELEDGANLQRLLQVLAGYYNNNVFHLPDFVAGVFSDGAVHLALRGSITAEVTQVNGFVRTVSALNPIAWEEVRLDDVAALVIQAHGAGTEALPLRSGVTRASMLHWQLREVNRLVGAVKSQAYSAYSSNSAASGVSAASAPATRSAQSVASAYSGYSAGSAASVYSPASVVPSAAEASAARSLLEDTPISEVSSQPVAGLLPSVPSPEPSEAIASARSESPASFSPSSFSPAAPSPSVPSPQLPAVPAPAPNPVAASASLAAELVPGQNPDLSIATASPAVPSPASFNSASSSPAAPSPAVQTPATEHFEAISSAPSPAPSGAHAARVAVDLPGQASASSAASAAANAFAPTSLLDVPAGAGPVPAPAAPSPEIAEAVASAEPASSPSQPKVSKAAAALAAMLGGSSAAKNQAPAPVAPSAPAVAPSAPVAPGASYRMDDAPATVPTEIVPAAPAVPSAPLAPGANFQEPAAYSAPAVPSAPLAAPSAPVVAPSAPLAAPSAPASSGELVIADARAARATAAPAAPQNQQNPEDQYFGHLYGQTIGVDVENAAVRELRNDEASGLEFNFEQGEGLDFSRRKGEKAEPTGPIQGINEGNPFSSSPFGGDPATAGSDPVPNPRTQSAELPLEAQATQINPVGNAVPLPGVQAPTGALDVAPGTPWTHDGYTIAVPTGGVQAPPPPVADSANADSDGPEVLAINCVNGHPNPVHASSCRICGGALNGKIVHVKRPSLGTLVASTGGSVTLDADVIVGRLPKAAPGAGVHLMAVASPTKSISKSHCRINIDDWELNLEDLNSTNGTYLLREGQLPRRLGGGQRELLRYGDRIDLGDGVVLSVEP